MGGYYITTYHSMELDGLEVFYRKAGDPDKPVILLLHGLLLHGFPSANHTFRALIPELEKDYYVIAPDYPGFGNTLSPDEEDFQYTFDHITEVIESFIDKLMLTKYTLYVFDYGVPIGFRIAMHRPEHVTAIISQNRNQHLHLTRSRNNIFKEHQLEGYERGRDFTYTSTFILN
ncbi:alpha/beta fold hydrolase [Paenibacillus sp. NPDC058177]|uniref:alpha/beta fold hydrolase n=1 Tax=Paenibacillus sp. NPDC058177 TaxID=3346369 RepID=UPI0036DD9C88